MNHRQNGDYIIIIINIFNSDYNLLMDLESFR